MRAFCEYWNALTNTFCTLGREESISLWDLKIIGDLPICGDFYDEVIPLTKELKGLDRGGKPYLSHRVAIIYFLLSTRNLTRLVIVMR